MIGDYELEHEEIEEDELPLFESRIKYRAEMFMMGWKIDNPTLPVRIIQMGDMWLVVNE